MASGHGHWPEHGHTLGMGRGAWHPLAIASWHGPGRIAMAKSHGQPLAMAMGRGYWPLGMANGHEPGSGQGHRLATRASMPKL